ncbi:MAG: hypothetical protein HC802_23385, partial [Caldilineaceae bacterium]|nr:hypothetical protein [Caldilineaceae bacterium]
MEAADMSALAGLGLSMSGYATYHMLIEVALALFVTLLAGVIFLRKFDDWMGVLTSFALVLFALNFMVETDSALVKQYPRLAAPHDLVTALAIVPFIMIFFLFPTGRFVPRWTRFVALALLVISLADPLLRAVGRAAPSGQFSMIYLFAVLGGLFVGLFAQIYRYRKVSTPTEQQQTKWVVFGLTLLFVTILG